MIPIGHANEPLQGHALLSKTIGDRLDVFVFEIREQSLYKGVGMVDLLAAYKAFDKRLHKLLQPRHHVVKHLRCSLALIQEFLPSLFKIIFLSPRFR
jgi:hypothetical protein